MRIETARFGTIDAPEEGVFTFPMGMLGFARHKRFVVLDHSDNSPFKWMQSVDDGELAFIITDPLFFRRDYHLSVRRAELSVIEPENAEDLVVSVIMTVPADPHDMSANLLAPLIFNMVNRRGMQYVLTDHRYPVKYHAMREQEAAAAEPVAATADDEPKSISLR
jgi:flagellar assembly factor FliW